MEQNTTMSEAPLMPAPKTPKDNTDRDIARLVNAGLMPRNKLPLLRAARKNLERRGDIAMIPRMQRQVYVDFEKALRNAALKTTGSVSAVRRNIGEETELNEEVFSAPQMLVLRRTGIRIFPDGRRVALYVNDKHNLVFSVPYSRNLGAEMPMVQAEEFVLESIEQLAEVKEGEVKKVKVGDESIDIGHQTAIDILNLHSKLNDQNKKLMQKHIKDPQQFKKIVKLATKTK
jgi:hypothetical protein